MSENEPSSDRTSNPTALQCNLISATSLKLHPQYFTFEDSMRLLTPSVFRDGHSILRTDIRKRRKGVSVNRLSTHIKPTKIFIIQHSIFKDLCFDWKKQKLFMIPYDIRKKLVELAPITPQQHKSLLISYKHMGSMTKSYYQQKLDTYLLETGLPTFTVYSIKIGDHPNGFIVAFCHQNAAIYGDGNIDDRMFEGTRVITLEYNKSNFNLPPGLTSVFRGYLWPFKVSLTEECYQILADTYTSK